VTVSDSVNEQAPGGEHATGRINVLFMQSQEFFGADSRIQAELMRLLDRDEFTVHVACNKGTGPDTSASLRAVRAIPDLGVRAVNFGPSRTGLRRAIVIRDAIVSGPLAIASLFELVRYARREKVAIVHGTEKPRDAFYGYVVSRAVGAKCVIHVHVKAENWISRLTRWAMGRSAAIVAISHFVAGSIEDLGYDARRIHTIHNGLDLRDWDPAKVDGSAVRREFGFSESTPVLAIVARMFFWKGHLELLHALGRVVQRRPDVRLLVVGEDDPRGAPGRESLSSEMRGLIDRLGLQDNVIFTGFRKDVPNIMAACDIFAMPSFEEPFGMVFLEAMALERPVVALDNGGTPEVVADGSTGLLSPPGDVDGLAANLLRLIDDPVLRETMGKAGRQRALEVFNPSAMARATECLYRQLVHAGRRTS
jgi:glycosyltransferase involved in cell wall biosynthesis